MSEDMLEIVKSYIPDDYSYTSGDVGEILTRQCLSNLGFRTLRNVYLKYDNISTEIDIIAVSEYGLLCVENKNWNGILCGSDADTMLTLRRRSTNDIRVYNPFMQNTVHIHVLCNVLRSVSLIPAFEPIVVFGAKNFKDLVRHNKFSMKYYKLDDLPQLMVNREPYYDIEDVDKVYSYLTQFSDSSMEKRLEFLIEKDFSKGINAFTKSTCV